MTQEVPSKFVIWPEGKTLYFWLGSAEEHLERERGVFTPRVNTATGKRVNLNIDLVSLFVWQAWPAWPAASGAPVPITFAL